MKRIYRNRKNTPAILALIIMLCDLAFFYGCSEDFLKPDPLSFYEPTTTFSTESGLQAALANCDKNLRNNWTHYTANSNSAPIATEYVYSDLNVATKADVGNNILSNIDAQLNPTQENLGHEGGDFRPFYWDEGYAGVKGANTILTFIDGVQLDEATKNAYKGRAYFHRAYRYYNLVFQFGDVPLITKIPEVPKFTYRSTKKAAILDMITTDLEFAVEWVPEQKNMDYVGMINKGACRMLLIKCYLATGQFQKAKDQADILINQSGYELMKNTFGTFIQNYSPETWPVQRNVIWDLHRAENKLIDANKEVIMGLPNRGSTAESMIAFYTMRVFGPMWNNANIKTPDGMNAVGDYARSNTSNYTANLDYTRAIGRGIGCYALTKFAQEDLWVVNGVEDNDDLRHNSAVGNWGRMDSIKCNNRSSAWYGKNLSLEDGFTLNSASTNNANQIWYNWPHYKLYLHDVSAEANQASTQFSGATTGGNADWYLYRLAEAYLLRAEAKFYLGDPAEAAADVNEVRKRAQCSQLYTTVGIDDIANERARELYLEEWRNVELTRISRSLALAGKSDNFGNFTPADADRLSEIESFWYHRVTKYGYYNKNVPIRNKTYSIAKHNIYWPVPSSAITANKKGTLSQNPGYDGYDPATPLWETWQDAVADEDKTN